MMTRSSDYELKDKRLMLDTTPPVSIRRIAEAAEERCGGRHQFGEYRSNVAYLVHNLCEQHYDPWTWRW